MSDLDEPVPPVVCTLSIGRREQQRVEWSDLGSLALSRRELDRGVCLTFPASLSEQVEDLANRETQCCGSWLDIEHHHADGKIELTLTTVSESGLKLIREMSS